MKRNALLLILKLWFIAFAAQSQEQLWGIKDGLPFHVGLNGENFTLIKGDTTGTGRAGSLNFLGSDNYLYGLTSDHLTQLRIIYKIHKDSTVYHPVIHLKAGSIISTFTLDESNTIFGGADDVNGSFIFKVDNDGKNFSILHRFPERVYINSLVTDEENIYGTFVDPVPSVVVFKLAKDGASYQFLMSRHGSPATPLLLTREGFLIWITSATGDFNFKQIYAVKKDGEIGVLYSLGTFRTEHPEINNLIQTRDGKIYGAFTAEGYPSVRNIFRIETDRNTFAELIQVQDINWVPGGAFIELPDGRLVSKSSVTPLLLTFSPSDGSQEFVPFQGGGSLNAIASDGRIFGTQPGDNFYTPPAQIYSANIDGSDVKIMHTFGVSEIGSITGTLIEGPDGNVYGNNLIGGKFTNGTVFKISPQGINKIFDNNELSVGPIYASTDGYIYSHNYLSDPCPNLTLFRFKTDGSGVESNCTKLYPISYSQPIQLSTGEMVGLSSVGYGNGFMYRLKPNLGGFDILRSFTRETGKQPVGKLLEGLDGYLYGVNKSGGAFNLGGIFKVKRDGTDYRMLVVFDGKNGWSTQTSLVQDKNGVLYGVIPPYNRKKPFIFSLNADGSDYKVAIDFTSAELAGLSPGPTLMMDNSGRLYNTGSIGEESFIYSMTTDGQELKKIVSGPVGLSFISKGSQPAIVQVIQPSNKAADQPVKIDFHVTQVLYAEEYTLQLSTVRDFSTITHTKTSATTSIEITGLDYGTTYFTRVKTNLWPAFGPVTQFRTKDAALRFWGVTATGGTGTNGTVFSISTDGTSFIKYHDYTGEDNDVYLHDKLIPLEDGATLLGYSVPPKDMIDNSAGEMFTIKVDGTGFNVIKASNHTYGGLMKTSAQSFYYADAGANLWRGAIFSFETIDQWISRHGFNRTDGMNPNSSLLEHDGYLYGMTPRGGYNNNSNGVIYRLRLNDNAFEKIHDFNKPLGKNPEGSLIDGTNGFLYGMTTSGGSANYGSIFRIKPDGTEFKKLHDFNNANGRRPMGDLVLSGGRLFGMTMVGGKYKLGVVFRINRDGSGYTILHHFSGADGAEPLKNLTSYKGYLYGMTSKGGASDLGVIFKIKADGTDFKKLFDFNWNTGGAPDGSLVLIPTPIPAVHQLATTEVATLASGELNEQVSVEAYPNPWVDDILYLQITGTDDGEFQSVMIDTNGRIVGTYNGTTDTTAAIKTELSPGIYVLKVKVGNITKAIRVVRR